MILTAQFPCSEDEGLGLMSYTALISYQRIGMSTLQGTYPNKRDTRTQFTIEKTPLKYNLLFNECVSLSYSMFCVEALHHAKSNRMAVLSRFCAGEFLHFPNLIPYMHPKVCLLPLLYLIYNCCKILVPCRKLEKLISLAS